MNRKTDINNIKNEKKKHHKIATKIIKTKSFLKYIENLHKHLRNNLQNLHKHLRNNHHPHSTISMTMTSKRWLLVSIWRISTARRRTVRIFCHQRVPEAPPWITICMRWVHWQKHHCSHQIHHRKRWIHHSWRFPPIPKLFAPSVVNGGGGTNLLYLSLNLYLKFNIPLVIPYKEIGTTEITFRWSLSSSSLTKTLAITDFYDSKLTIEFKEECNGEEVPTDDDFIDVEFHSVIPLVV